MKSKEDILNEAIEILKSGKSVSEVSSAYPETPELSKMLLSVSLLKDVPTLSAPEPAMRRKFAVEPITGFVWGGLFHMLRFSAVSTAAVLLVTGLTGTAYATFKSLPGQTLFPLKKQAERIQLHLTSDPVQKANIQISISQKRLAEAERVFSNPEKTSEQEIAALNELSSQTKETAHTVKTAANTNNLTSNGHPVVNSFADVTKKQQDLLSKINEQEEVTVAANTAREANQEAREAIAVVAATNDVANLTSMYGSSNLATASGRIDELTKNSIRVDEDLFTIDEKTSIKNFDGAILSFSELATGTTVHISGSKIQNKLVANEIMSVTFTGSGDVKGTSTPASTATTTKPALETKTSTSTKRSTVSTSSTTPETDPNQATGGFIPEFP